jgi:hypothetical protein
MKRKNIRDWRVLERLGVECDLERQGLTKSSGGIKAHGRAPPADHHLGGVPYIIRASYTISRAYSLGAIIEAMILTVRD